ncbi:MAG: hypothetical protein KatS3mg111_4371 [Pirellulaceae bacterium]|nr:MAG: hypothetical protein KatS3mg111_4371 [Pirellulaceae bacterium]
MGMATIPPPQSVDEQIGAPKRRLGAFLKWTITHRRWVTLVVRCYMMRKGRTFRNKPF